MGRRHQFSLYNMAKAGPERLLGNIVTSSIIDPTVLMSRMTHVRAGSDKRDSSFDGLHLLIKMDAWR